VEFIGLERQLPRRCEISAPQFEEFHVMTTSLSPSTPTDHDGSVDVAEFAIGAKVRASDETVGKLVRVVIDPIHRRLTHLVVEPHDEGLGRLVPLNLVASSSSDEIVLSCTRATFLGLDPSRDTDYLPMNDFYGSYYRGYSRGFGYGYGGASYWPYYGLGGWGYGGWGSGYGSAGRGVSYDSTPKGEITIRRGDAVRALDGDIGHVAGLVIGTQGGDVTHLLLQEGHLWGKKDVAIPIRSVKRVAEVVEVSMTKKDLEALPAVDIDHPELVGPTP